MEKDYDMVWLCVFLSIILIGIPVSFLLVSIPSRIEADHTIQYEGTITEKKISQGLRTAYIFRLNGTTDVRVDYDDYNTFLVGDYIYIYESGRIIKK